MSTNRIVAIVSAVLAVLSVFLVNPFIEDYSMTSQVLISAPIGVAAGCVLYLILRRGRGSQKETQRS